MQGYDGGTYPFSLIIHADSLQSHYLARVIAHPSTKHFAENVEVGRVRRHKAAIMGPAIYGSRRNGTNPYVPSPMQESIS
jgi:hypothetical protein